MKQRKTALLKSGLAVLLALSMLVGSTFAWFTDSVTSKSNIIKAGKLDVEMYWTDDLDSGVWHNVEEDGKNTIFSYDNWEPGYTDVKYIKLVNNGNLALNYKLTLTPENGVGKLAEVINVYFADEAVEMNGREDLDKLGAIGLLNTVLNGGATANGTLLADGQQSPLHPTKETVMTLAMTMITTAGNEYQEEDAGDFTITALATQAPFEQDAFGANYDGNAEYPQLIFGGSVTATFNPDNGKVPAGGVTLKGNGIAAYAPAGVALKNGADQLKLSVTPLQNTTSDITVVNNEILIPVDVHVDGVAEDNTTPIIVDLGEVLPKYLNMGNYHLFHVEDGANSVMTLVDSRDALTAHNTFTYDPYTGAVSVALASFSEVALVADTSAGWEGKYDYDWYNTTDKNFELANADQLAAFGKIVGGMATDFERDTFDGKTVKLLSDINLNGGKATVDGKTKVFYPIGYYNTVNGETSGIYDRDDAEVVGMAGVSSSVSAFKGTFDGNGHTIANFYQNTWEMFGDYNNGYSGTPNYYKDAMGLFGYVYGGTVKNLTVDHFSSDGEFTPTGVIAAYAANSDTKEALFENIAITSCTPRVYNTGNGGIIGIAGNSNDRAATITLKNITVDNTNTITALWGSYDVACGGLVGMFRGNADGGKGKIHFENCHVSAKLDVYNDVCGNYQYYAYRYAGMIIGSIRHNETKDGKTIPNMAGITAEGCTVDYGTWNDYYYCEFEKNSLASYSEDYQFSRVPHSELVFTDSDENGEINSIEERASVSGCKHTHTPAEDKQAVYLPFAQLFTGYSWGVSSIGLTELQGITNITITEGNQEKSVEKFATKFTGDFLYRVGNKNALPVGALFQQKDGAPEIKDAGVWVTVEKLNDEMNVSGTFTANTTDWTQGTLKFEGTGIAKITIQDYNFCTPTVLYVEVVDAVNVAENGKIGNYNTTSVLLGNTTLNTLYLNGGATLYGNGFTIDCTNAPVNGTGSVSENYIIGLVDAHLDNVKVVGKVYTEYGAMASNDYNRALVVSKGNSTITNCYLSNTASPIRLMEGALAVKGTTVKGGNFANIDVRNGHLTVEDVTTINQARGNDKAENGTTVIGLGIVVYYENVDTALTSVTIKGTLTQYNHISTNDKFSHDYAEQLVNQMMKSDHADLQETVDNVTWVNPGYVAMTKVVPADKRNDIDGYIEKEVRFNAQDGYVYAKKPTTESVKETPATYKTLGQGLIAPQCSFDYTTKNYVAKTDDSNDYCYYDSGKVLIAMDQGDTFEWDPFILTAIKNGKTLNYTVSYGGKTYAPGEKIVFNTSGDYTITYTYIDDINYTLVKDAQGKQVPGTFETSYTQAVNISVSVIKPTAQHATFTFADTNTETEKVTVNDKTYISAKGVSATDKEWGYITVNGTKIFYPITDAVMNTSSKLLGGKETQVYYYVFKDTVTITDYKDGGTGGKQTYNADTKAMPSNLTVVNGMEAKYTAVSSACVDISKLTKDGPSGEVWDFSASTTVSGTTTYNNYLAHSSPSGLSVKDGTRDYDAITVAQFSYTDAAGATYYYFVGYFMQNQNTSDSGGGSNPCVTSDTLVTLADGTQKRIDEVTYSDKLLVWNFYEGKYDVAPIAIIFDHGADNNTVIELTFSDGTKVKVVNMHQFYDNDLRTLVTINEETVAGYLGHKFAKHNAGKTDLVELTSYAVSHEYVEAWGIMTAEHYNIITADMLSADFDLKDVELFNYFKVGEDMKYDADQMKADIEKYGLYSYSDFADYLTYEQFVAFNVQYFKIPVCKGLYTYDGILELIEKYLN